jgi:hypothetical protein
MRVRAQKVSYDGIMFRSRTEGKHYLDLKALQQAGRITKLQYEPKFTFIVNGIVVGTYKPDFTYLDHHDVLHVEDCKGWKRHLQSRAVECFPSFAFLPFFAATRNHAAGSFALGFLDGGFRTI